jgi:hypothetical protein
LKEQEGAVMITNYQDTKISGRRSGSDRRMFADPNYKGLEKRVAGDRRKGTRKRSQQRFKAKEGVYVTITSDYDIIGLIKDISKGGLALQYVADRKKLIGLLAMDIFSNDKSFYLKEILFKTVKDFYVDNKVPFSMITLRQCCGKFVDLTDEQTSQLDNFIQDYTLSEA